MNPSTSASSSASASSSSQASIDPASDAVAPAIGSLTPDQAAFLECLADARLWPVMAHRLPLLQFLANALPTWNRWPVRLGLDVVAQRGDQTKVIHRTTFHCHERLRVTYRVVDGNDSCSARLCPHDAPPGNPDAGALPVADGRQFGDPPNGFFSALADGLSMLTQPPQFRGVSARPCPPGEQLRAAFAEWLRQSAQRWAQFPVGMAWQLTEVSASPGPSVSERKDAIRAPLAPPSPDSKATEMSWWRQADKLRLLPPPRQGPGSEVATAAEAAALCEALKAGQWRAGMLPVLGFALTRLRTNDPGFPNLLHAIQLEDTEGRKHLFDSRAIPTSGSTRRIIEMRGTDAAPSFIHRTSGIACLEPQLPFHGLDGLMRAYCVASVDHEKTRGALMRRPAELAHHAERVRQALCEVLADRTELVQLCLTLQRMWPQVATREPLLRQCLDGDTLTQEGRQVLEPHLAWRPLRTAQDHAALFALSYPAGERRNTLFRLGYPLLLANQFLDRPRQKPRNSTETIQLTRMIRAEGGWCLYVSGTWNQLFERFSVSPRTFHRNVDASTKNQLRAEAQARLDATMLQVRPALPSNQLTAT